MGKNKLLSKSISWSIEPKYAKKKTVKGSQPGGGGRGGQGGLDFFPTLTVFFKASLTTLKCLIFNVIFMKSKSKFYINMMTLFLSCKGGGQAFFTYLREDEAFFQLFRIP